MKALKSSLAMKILAIIVLTAMAIVFVFSGMVILQADSEGMYTAKYEDLYKNQIENFARNQLIGRYHEQFDQYYYVDYLGDPNFEFVANAEGKEIINTSSTTDYEWRGLAYGREDYGDIIVISAFAGDKVAEERMAQQMDSLNKSGTPYVIGGVPYVRATNGRLAMYLIASNYIFSIKNLAIAVLAVSAIIGIICFVYLLAAAGHKDKSGEIELGYFDKIPYDVYSIGIMTIIVCAIALAGETIGSMVGSMRDLVVVLIIVAIGVVIGGLVLLHWFMSTAVRIKNGGLFKNTLCYKFFAFCKKLIKLGLYGISRLPLLGKYALLVVGVVCADFMLSMTLSYGRDGPAWLIRTIFMVPAMVYIILYFKRIREGTKAIARGENATISTKYIFGELKAEAEDLNNINAGLGKAVEERMKSERFKTELITNVSHDIKTPLTSIINYTDLLSKEEIENEKAKEYIEVLSRQADKLKKLVEDLIEASKAATGALKVDLVKTELGVLLEQTEGEYEDKLRQNGLELIVTKPESPVYIMGDSRHMWRIFDNLMNNIVKYAHHGTRVYLSLHEEGENAIVTFKNISADALNIPAEKLMERFVRGDEARHSSGSGLGLSIANSLTSLQNGELKLEVDGDLFKVTLKFRLMRNA